MALRRLLTVALPSLGLAAGLTACGGGVSKSAFVAKANTACTSSAGALAGVAKPTNLPELAIAADKLAGAADAQTAGLRGVKPPADDKAAVAGITAAFAEVGGPARALHEAAGRTDDAATGRAANDVMAKVGAAALQADGYGLGQCSKSLKDPATTVFEGGRTVLRAVFVGKVDALCQAANKKADALAAPSSLTSVGKYLASYLPIETKLFADIKALPVPPGDEATVADMLGAQDQVIAKDKDSQAAAAKNNASLFDRLDQEEASLMTAANAKFDAYGLRTCGTLGNF